MQGRPLQSLALHEAGACFVCAQSQPPNMPGAGHRKEGGLSFVCSISSPCMGGNSMQAQAPKPAAADPVWGLQP